MLAMNMVTAVNGQVQRFVDTVRNRLAGDCRGRDGGSGWLGTVAPARPAEPVGLTQPATRRMWARTLLVLVACIAGADQSRRANLN